MGFVSILDLGRGNNLCLSEAGEKEDGGWHGKGLRMPRAPQAVVLNEAWPAGYENSREVCDDGGYLQLAKLVVLGPLVPGDGNGFIL